MNSAEASGPIPPKRPRVAGIRIERRGRGAAGRGIAPGPFTAGLTVLVLSPVAGSLADRWDRRRLLILSDLGSALTTLTMAALLFSGRMQPWHVYPVVALMVGFGVFQGPALLASISLLVPK